MQGYLFPDTYILPEGATTDDLVAMMITTLDERFTPDLRAAAMEHGLNPHQALTLAAIVEREAVLAGGAPAHRRGVLQPAGGGGHARRRPDGPVRGRPRPEVRRRIRLVEERAHAGRPRDPDPYNTRAVPGLPPGPITNPGLASIEAVAHPADTEYYYFVANAVKADGSHLFAVTFDEHQRNDAQFGAP